MLVIKMKRALVMSGGGGKGAYQFGVWRALRKLNIDFDIVTGTSIGALNGALMVQDDFFPLWHFWKKVDFDMAFGYKINNDIDSKYGKKEVFEMYKKGIIKDKGMSTEKMHKLANRFISEKRIRNSNIDYGIVTFNLSDFKAVTLTKKDIPEGKMIDYIIASASCFPAFQMKDIDGKKYIDGGYYDNMPINLAISMGADEIIAVNLRSFGLNKKIKGKNKNVKITYISPNNSLGSFLLFDRKYNRRNMRYGYNDAMKTFGALDGKEYTFKKNELKLNYEKYHSQLKELIEANMNVNKKLSKLVYDTTISDILNNKKSNLDNLIESLGQTFELNDSKIYSMDQFNKTLKLRVKNMEDPNNHTINVFFQTKGKLNNKFGRYLIKYFYSHSISGDETKKLALLFPKYFVMAMYLQLL